MKKVEKKEIEKLAKISGLNGFSGDYKELGGGELNDTFLLDCDPDPVILRVARYPNGRGLLREATALSHITHSKVPRLIFFDEKQRIDGRGWILESYMPGESVERLSPKQFESLGKVLAEIHSSSPSKKEAKSVWDELLSNSSSFGDEEFHLVHPHPRLRKLVHRMKEYCAAWQPKFEGVPSVIVHGDATPSNILVQGDEVALIDWELTSNRDGLSEFSTIYYDDIEYNQGKWRIKITPEEKRSLFVGYEAGGGTIDEERINFWMNHDKMGAALFLYWRIHGSGRDASDEQMAQYQLDLDTLIESLERNVP